jgi:hypothetical protein
MIMTKGDDIGLVMLKDISPNDLIETILEQIRIVLEKVLHHGHELGLMLPPPMQMHLTNDKIVYYISKPWRRRLSNVHQLLIREGLKDEGSL